MTEKKEVTAQHARFLETARALDCDEDEAAFDEKLRGIMKPSLFESGDPSGDGAESSKNGRKPQP